MSLNQKDVPVSKIHLIQGVFEKLRAYSAATPNRAGHGAARQPVPQGKTARSWLSTNTTNLSFRTLAKACCEMSRRDGAIVAWHEVPGTAPPQKGRPVGYGLIRAGVRTDSMIGATKFRARTSSDTNLSRRVFSLP